MLQNRKQENPQKKRIRARAAIRTRGLSQTNQGPINSGVWETLSENHTTRPLELLFTMPLKATIIQDFNEHKGEKAAFVFPIEDR